MPEASEKIEKQSKGDAPSGPENRTSPRFPFSTTAEAIDIQGNTRVVGRIADIARKGCYVDTISPFPPKAAVSLRITREKETFETKATVVYSQTGMGMGLRFTTADAAQLGTLERWLAELSGEGMHEPGVHGPGPAGPTPPTPSVDEKFVDQESRRGLSELVRVLNHKGILDGSEEDAILRRLSK